MRRYLWTLAILALLTGSLFRAAAQTGVGLMRMFGTFGIFLFGVVGSSALHRRQSDQGRKETERALKSLEPEFLITDWSFQKDERPDYLLVGSGELVVVSLDSMPQSSWPALARRALSKAEERAKQSVHWLKERLEDMTGSVGFHQPPFRGEEMPVEGILVLTRRQIPPGYSVEGLKVINAERLVDYVRSLQHPQRLDESARVQLTRKLRGFASSADG